MVNCYRWLIHTPMLKKLIGNTRITLLALPNLIATHAAMMIVVKNGAMETATGVTTIANAVVMIGQRG